MSTTHYLTLPPSDEQIQKLRSGDTVFLTGELFTARDHTHQFLLDQQTVSFHPEEMAMYHCGPLMKRMKKEWVVVSAGPTTSHRMDAFEEEFIRRYGLKIIIGKGGMGIRTQQALQDHGGVYLAFPGGAGVVAADSVIRVDDVYYLSELGMTEAVWIFSVQEFGPLVVAIDAHGDSLYKN
jgi:tartrate/fumarate subfamily iron-sulfur-dependent hydro-lyase beta chain